MFSRLIVVARAFGCIVARKVATFLEFQVKLGLGRDLWLTMDAEEVSKASRKAKFVRFTACVGTYSREGLLKTS